MLKFIRSCGRAISTRSCTRQSTSALRLRSRRSATRQVDRNTTIAGNAIGDDTVLRIGDGRGGKLYRSIIWQPGRTTLHLNGGPALNLLDDMVSERTSVDDGNTRMWSCRIRASSIPNTATFSLRAGSPAIDRTSSVAGDSTDLYSNARDVNLPISDFGGVRDLGAIERQVLQPLVLNSDFDTDLRLWNTALAGSTSWDSSKNISGAAGSGEAHVTASSAVTGSQIGGIVQCVHLPGPGIYSLNGWGRGTGTILSPRATSPNRIGNSAKTAAKDAPAGRPVRRARKFFPTAPTGPGRRHPTTSS